MREDLYESYDQIVFARYGKQTEARPDPDIKVMQSQLHKSLKSLLENSCYRPISRVNFLFSSLVKALILILFFCGTVCKTSAQVDPDSLAHELASTSQKLNIDSIQQNLQPLPDSLLPSFHRIDSIRNDFNLAADSIQTQYQNTLRKIDAETSNVNQSIDSLQRLKLPANKYTERLDSLNDLRQTIESKFTARLNSLKAKTTGKLNALDLPPEYREPLQKLTTSVNDVNLGSGALKIPALKIPGYKLPDINGISDLTSKAPEIGDLKNAGKLPDIETPVGDLDKVTQQAKGYQEDMQNITEGNLKEVQAIPETIEEQASKVEGIDELQKQSGVIDEHKAQLDKLADPENAKEKVKEMAKKAATDHFAGKQEQLKAAMEKISKYKQKYSSVSSIKDLPKRPPNPMKSKPFIERLVPGLFLQYSRRIFISSTSTHTSDTNSPEGLLQASDGTIAMRMTTITAHSIHGRGYSVRARMSTSNSAKVSSPTWKGRA